MKQPLFKGSATALVTPFKDGRINYDVMKKLIDMQIEGSWVGKARPEEYPVQMEIDWVKMYELKQ